MRSGGCGGLVPVLLGRRYSCLLSSQRIVRRAGQAQGPFPTSPPPLVPTARVTILPTKLPMRATSEADCRGRSPSCCRDRGMRLGGCGGLVPVLLGRRYSCLLLSQRLVRRAGQAPGPFPTSSPPLVPTELTGSWRKTNLCKGLGGTLPVRLGMPDSCLLSFQRLVGRAGQAPGPLPTSSPPLVPTELTGSWRKTNLCKGLGGTLPVLLGRRYSCLLSSQRLVGRAGQAPGPFPTSLPPLVPTG
jgi:hypothetical protein